MASRTGAVGSQGQLCASPAERLPSCRPQCSRSSTIELSLPGPTCVPVVVILQSIWPPTEMATKAAVLLAGNLGASNPTLYSVQTCVMGHGSKQLGEDAVVWRVHVLPRGRRRGRYRTF